MNLVMIGESRRGSGMARRQGVCRKCNYDLHGLAEEGTCPECGNEYNYRTGKGMMSGSEQRLGRDRWFRRILTILVGMLAACALFCAGFPFFISGLESEIAQKTVSWFGFIAVFLVLVTLTSYFSERDNQDDEEESML